MREGNAIEEWQFEGGSTWGAAAGEVVNESEGGSGCPGKTCRVGKAEGKGVCLCEGTSVHVGRM
jgi:hypothetical protein